MDSKQMDFKETEHTSWPPKFPDRPSRKSLEFSLFPAQRNNRQSILMLGAYELNDSPPESRAGSIYEYNKELPERPYHVFTISRKKQLVYIVSLAGSFSPLSSNIYFPALGDIATSLKTSISLLSLTITIYMIVQGIAPSFWGPFSDTLGRRPIFVGTFMVYLIANVGLGLSQNFASLMFFRGLQAAGSAATISIGAGVIGDITTPAERGGLIGVFGGIRMLAQSIGPVFGGLITQFLGFRAIFWFLTGMGMITLVLILAFLPETLRAIAGDGTVRLKGFQVPWIYYIQGQPDAINDQDPSTPKKKITFKDVVSPLKFLFEKDVFATLFFGSIIYTVWSMVTSSTTALFQDKYHLSNLMTGLAFLPNGAGCVLGSYLTGYIMDYDYQKIEKAYCESHGFGENGKKFSKKNLPSDFPIESARLRNTWWHVILFILTVAFYGLSLRSPIVAPPLIIQFVIAYTATAIFSMNSALVVDLYPGASASATAVNNLMRCSVGAAGVAVIQPMIDAIGAEAAFAILSGIVVLTSPLVWVEYKYGAGWRIAREERLKAQK